MTNPEPDIIVSGDEKDFPMRLNRFLAISGVSSRRGADELIGKKKASINGKLAELGSKVSLGDAVSLSTGRPGGAHKEQKYVYLAYSKQAGAELDRNPKTGVPGLPPNLSRLAPADLLEKDAEGLVILTNDTRIARAMSNPRTISCEYFVSMQEKASGSFLKKLETGVVVGAETLAASKVLEDGATSFTIRIKGTRKDVRRMCEALHHTPLLIRRKRIGSVKMTSLKPGAYRPIEGKELADLLAEFGLA